MEGISNKSIESRMLGKEVIVRHDEEYECSYCKIKSISVSGCTVIINKKEITFKYSELEGIRSINKFDILEFDEWYDTCYKRWVNEKKIYNEIPKGLVDVIYREAASYLNTPEKKALERMFHEYRAVEVERIPKIKEYFDMAREVLVMKMESSK